MRIVSTIICFFCVCISVGATDVDAVQATVRDARRMLGTAQHDEGVKILTDATVELEQHLEENPKDVKAAYELGMTFFYLDNDTRAIESYALAAELNPKIYQPWFFTGLVHSYADQFDEGEAAFLKAIELAPKDVDTWYELGLMYYNAVQDEKAIAAFKKVLSLDPEHMKASKKLAFSCMDLDEAKKIYPVICDAVKNNPDDIDSLYDLGQLCQNLGKTNESLAAFEKVVELDPTLWRAIEKLVQLNQALGNMDARDRARQKVFELKKAKSVESLNEEPLYIRDQFPVENQYVMALEYFEMVGDRAVRYSFVITDKTGKNKKYRITLGSYDSTNDYAERQGKNKPGERTFHLDGYHADGGHRTFTFFRGEPDYDEVKEMVVEILNGDRNSISSTMPTAGD